MPLIAPKSGKSFPLPKEGTVQAVIAEIIDLGLVKGSYKGVPNELHKIRVRWQLAELDENGQPLRKYETFTFSMHENARLHGRVKGIFGKEPPMDFDCEKLVGVNCNLVLVHETGTDGKQYANIVATLKLNPGQKKLEIVAIPKKDEVKAEVAAQEKKAAGARPVTEEDPIVDEDIPW